MADQYFTVIIQIKTTLFYIWSTSLLLGKYPNEELKFRKLSIKLQDLPIEFTISFPAFIPENMLRFICQD
jgi:hypothetical protein